MGLKWFKCLELFDFGNKHNEGLIDTYKNTASSKSLLDKLNQLMLDDMPIEPVERPKKPIRTRCFQLVHSPNHIFNLILHWNPQ